MAKNGSAPGFRDRRGENPFVPVKPAANRIVRPEHRPGLSPVPRDFESYNGMGARGYNGRKGYSLNGQTISRQSPDEQKRYQTEVQLGLRREGEV